MDKMILVTGGSGRLGRAVIAELLQHGYAVRNADRHGGVANVRTIRTDLCDMGQVYGAMTGVDAAVHLAAIPYPLGDPPEVVLQNNVLSTFNVLQAASVLGIKKVIMASSLSALGLAYNFIPVRLEYFPIDEAHPVLAQDVYGMSKVIGEEMGETFARRIPDMSLFSLRLPWLVDADDPPKMSPTPEALNEHGVSILWSYLDIRDGAEAIRLALEYEGVGHEIFYLNAPDTFTHTPTLDLIRQYYPDVKCDAERLQGTVSPIDCSRGFELLKFFPRYDWRERLNSQETEPHV